MRYLFKDRKLEALYTTEKGTHKYAHAVVEAFFEAIAIIEAAVDERDLRAIKSLHYEKLSGNRQGQRSLRLGGQFRLIVTPTKDEKGDIIWVIEIVDYH